jgi:hypothetical protein
MLENRERGARDSALRIDSSTRNFVILSLIVAAGFTPLLLTSQSAFAGGAIEERPISPVHGLGDKKPALSITITPNELVSGASGDIYLHLRIFDSKTNETIKYPTMRITITPSDKENAKPIMQDLFQSKNGLLTLQITTQKGDVQILGDREPFLGALTTDPGTDTIKMKGPFFLEPGVYRVNVDLYGVDYPTNIFADQDAVHFGTDLHIR